jgi:hypothetical protein
MSLPTEFDAVIFYYWLQESEVDSIFVGGHKWWFLHGMGYKTCIFYGPTITQYSVVTKGPMTIVRLPFAVASWGNIKSFLSIQGISTAPILSIVIESNILPEPQEVRKSRIPIQCLIADTHHMRSPITTALNYLAQVSPLHICVSHSPHRQIFSDCLSQPTSPLVYTPCKTIADYNRDRGLQAKSASYYGTVHDSFHPERTYVVDYLLNDPLGKSLLKAKPRMSPIEWELSVSQDLAAFTCSLNGFPSVQSYVPLVYGTCLISDYLSPASDLGKLLIHGTNCLLYSSPQEALEILKFVISEPKTIASIGRMGQHTLRRNKPSIAQLLVSQITAVSSLNDGLSVDSQNGAYSKFNAQAINACFAYEIIQEIHRLSRNVFVSIHGDSETASFLYKYLGILPRVAKKRIRKCSNNLEISEATRCTVEIKALPLDAKFDKYVNSGITLNISSWNKPVKALLEAQILTNPNSILYPFYEGVTFSQYLPSSIVVSKCPNGKREYR